MNNKKAFFAVTAVIFGVISIILLLTRHYIWGALFVILVAAFCKAYKNAKDDEEKELERARQQIRYEANQRRIAAEKQAKRDASAKAAAEILEQIPEFTFEPSLELAPQGTLSTIADIHFGNVTSKTPRSVISNFVALDVETTGLKPAQDEIVEIAAIRFRSWEPVEKFTCLCKPKKPIGERVSAINHITNDMLENCPHARQVTPALAEFIGKDVIVGQNLSFDLNFLVKNGYNPTDYKGRRYFDTLDLARRIVKGEDNYKLATICEHYGIAIAVAHRAAADALATGQLFKSLAKERE